MNEQAEAVSSAVCSAHNFVNSIENTEVSNCIKCSVYEIQLREALEELSSLKLINKLLQKELFAYTTHQYEYQDGGRLSRCKSFSQKKC
jgi:hypothetical protein